MNYELFIGEAGEFSHAFHNDQERGRDGRITLVIDGTYRILLAGPEVTWVIIRVPCLTKVVFYEYKSLFRDPCEQRSSGGCMKSSCFSTVNILFSTSFHTNIHSLACILSLTKKHTHT